VTLGYIPEKKFGKYLSSDFVVWDPIRRQLAAQALAEPDGRLPDILCLQEVENIDAIRKFNQDYLGGHYPYAILIDGWDPRNIDVALLSVFPIVSLRSRGFSPNFMRCQFCDRIRCQSGRQQIRAVDVVAAKLKPFCGTLTADAEHRFNDVFASGRMLEAGCNAHGRRQFRDAEATHPVLAVEGDALPRGDVRRRGESSTTTRPATASSTPSSEPRTRAPSISRTPSEPGSRWRSSV
jgi:hypothetical protein